MKILLGAVYLIGIAGAAWAGLQYPEKEWEIRIYGTALAALPLGFLALGGEALFEERMSHKRWILIPRYEFLPFFFCFGVGLLIYQGFGFLYSSVVGFKG